jgi:hypothetical protein
MVVPLRLAVTGSETEAGEEAAPADSAGTAELAAWLEDDDELRGLVAREPAPVREGTLGAELAQVAVDVVSSGTASALASVLIAWLRRSTGGVSVTLTRSDGSVVKLRADRVRKLGAADLHAAVDQLTTAVWPQEPPQALAPEPPEPPEPASEASPSGG